MLAGADLLGADFRFANGLTTSSINVAKNWECALLPDPLLGDLHLARDHNEQLVKMFADRHIDWAQTTEVNMRGVVYRDSPGVFHAECIESPDRSQQPPAIRK